MNILFVTDLHGSSLVFQKALALARSYDVDLLVMGGDVSGKHMLPVVKCGESYELFEPYKGRDETGAPIVLSRSTHVVVNDLPNELRRLAARGFYWHICDRDELDRLNGDSSALAALSREKILSRLMEWAEMAKVQLGGIPCIWTGGNDDEEDVLREAAENASDAFRYVEERPFELDGVQVVSVGYTNPTPFETSRETSEIALAEKLRVASRDVNSAYCVLANLHAPPYGCGALDLVGNPDRPGETKHVGSHAVRDFIERVQPLVALVGHIHEGKGVARLGRTDVFNPGSDYAAGVLQGFVLRLAQGEVADFVHVSR